MLVVVVRATRHGRKGDPVIVVAMAVAVTMRSQHRLLLVGQQPVAMIRQFVVRASEDNPLEHRKHVPGGKDDHQERDDSDPLVVLPRAQDRQELTNEARHARQADTGEGEESQEEGVERHAPRNAAERRDQAGVRAFVEHTDQKEERSGVETVGDHHHHRAVEPAEIGAGGQEDVGKDAQRHESHMGNGRIGDQLLEVWLHKGNERSIDDADQGKRDDDPGPVL